MNGWEAQVRFGKNGSSGSFAVGQCVRMLNWTTAGNFRSAKNVYVASGKCGMPELSLDNEVATNDVAKNEYAGLPIFITTGTGINQRNMIVGNEAATAATHKLKLYLATPLAIAPVNGDDVQIVPLDIVEKTTAALDILGGVCVSAPTAGSYFWRQVKGLALILVHGSTTFTATTSQPYVMSTTAGAAEIAGSETPAQACPSPALGIAKAGAGDTLAIALINTVFSI
jgi:hypothetical protein